jgi:hypothetical protein
MFYVYEHIRPDTGAIFYVGKGCKNRCNETHNRNGYWNNVVNKSNGFSVRKIVENVDKELAFLVEMERINQLKRLGFKLANLTNGGEGSSNPSEETRRKMSESHKGEKNSRFNINSRRQRRARKEFVPKDVMSANMKKNHWSKTGVYSPPKGGKRSEEDRQKMRDALKKVPLKECPHCGCKAKPSSIGRWHNDNCKLKGKNEMSKTNIPQIVTIDGTDFDVNDFNENQILLLNHTADLDRKIASTQFQLQQLNVGKDAFLTMLKEALKDQPAEAEVKE